METAIDTRTFTLQIPQSDTRFLSTLAKKMGWIKKEQPSKKCGLDAALKEVEKGKLKSFDSVDALMDYLHS
ncbi:MAG: hypothetical protein J6C31_07935 [Prevotella sp.]|nr:hypothetical protein [Prevotella sp.]MBO5062523.1 hypothetical protein [Prevotella sp.]